MAAGAALITVATLVACNGDQKPEPRDGANGPTTTVPPTTTTVLDVTVIPPVIDVAYVQRVMDVLDGVLLQVGQSVAGERALGERFQLYVRALYDADQVPAQSQGWQASVDKVAAQPNRPVTRVRQLVSASSTCVFLAADRDISPMFSAPIPVVQPYWLKLERDQPDGVNPTPWVLGHDTFYRSGRPPPDLCRQ